jgi:hypothetical protein
LIFLIDVQVLSNFGPLSKTSSLFEIAFLSLTIPFLCFGVYTLLCKRFTYNEVNIEDENTEPIITISEEEIVCNYPSSFKKEKISWRDITKIQVLTTDEGPYLCDVFLILRDTNDKGIVIPQYKQKETKQVLDRILKFEGFDNRLFIEAMGSTEIKWFTVWEKDKPFK